VALAQRGDRTLARPARALADLLAARYAVSATAKKMADDRPVPPDPAVAASLS
jgi:hypothetical protein